MYKFGLTTKQAEESRLKYGSNKLTELKGESFWKKLLSNFGDPMIKILCVALIINTVFAILGQSKWYEPIGIAVAVMIATMVSTFSEYKNENAFQKLQEESSKIKCKIYRDGMICELSIDEIVVGDAIVLQTGDKVPADGLIMSGFLKIDQSVLNGEAKEASKKSIPADYVDTDTGVDFLNEYKIFRGSVVCSGSAVVNISTVGDKSVYGQIASELQVDNERESPLKVKLSKLAGGISKFGYIGGILIAIVFLFQKFLINNDFDAVKIAQYFDNWMTPVNDAVKAVMLAVIIIVMAVPEGLPLMIAIVSAQNMGKMLKDHVLVRKVEGIETAGSLNILFSDKTGTITKGNLEAVTFIDGKGEEYKNLGTVVGGLKNLLSLCIKNNTNAIISQQGNDLRVVGGNATERAILEFAARENSSSMPSVAVLSSIPFDSANKYSATSISCEGEMTLIKGAPEKIICKCTSIYDKDGQVVPVSDFGIINTKIDELAERAIRVLALATSKGKIIDNQLPEDEWTLVGVIGIRDEIRPESIVAIGEVQNAGVQVVMITGDRKETAVAIAKESGLIRSNEDIVLTSSELQDLSDEQIKEILPHIRVIARALPSDKSRLVKVAQELNLVVGMTGDGVNDSPALKKADVGFAMGSGTDVAKEASDIVIMNDNFNSIDKAILYGRTIFSSIRKFIIFQLSINIAAVLISFFIPLFKMPNPLSITQILWINLIMDTLAALAFGGEPALKSFMKDKPKRRDESIISKNMWSSIIVSSFYAFAIGMVFYLTPAFKNLFPGDRIRTGYFTLFVFIAVFNAFNARTEKFNLLDNISKNHGFWRILGIIVAVQILLVYIGGAVFDCNGLNIIQWLIIFGLSIAIIPIDLCRKLVVKKVFNKKISM